MRKMLCAVLAALLAIVPAAYAFPALAESAGAFQPRLDPDTECTISVIGSYSNFEALEAEFDRFNEYYPDVELSYTKPDDYNNLLGTVLESNNAPNIFFSSQWMLGNEKYRQICDHMEDLSDPQLGLELDCLRPGLLSRDTEGHLPMVPIFARNYGMLVNNDLFAKEGLEIPTTWEELQTVCEAFLSKGYASPIMGYSADASGCFMNILVYPEVVATLAGDAEALRAANEMEPSAGEYMRPALEAMMQLIEKGYINLEKCGEISDNYTEVILRFFEGDVPMMICTGDTVSGTGKRESQSEDPRSAVGSRRIFYRQSLDPVFGQQDLRQPGDDKRVYAFPGQPAGTEQDGFREAAGDADDGSVLRRRVRAFRTGTRRTDSVPGSNRDHGSACRADPDRGL